jgi:hypothetical protein
MGKGEKVLIFFHWPPSWDLESPPSFSFSLKGKFKSFGAFFFGHNFLFKI